MDFEQYPNIKKALQSYDKSINVSVREKLGRKGRADDVCALVEEEQIVVTDKQSRRYVGSANNAICYSVYVRNPQSTATVVAHFTDYDRTGKFEQAVQKILGKDKSIDVYVTVGWDFDNPAGLEQTLESIKTAVPDAKINYKYVNLNTSHIQDSSVLDTTNGDFHYIPKSVADKHIVKPRSNENYDVPMEVVFDGIALRRR